MRERVKLVLAYAEDEASMAELCRYYGVSRRVRTGYIGCTGHALCRVSGQPSVGGLGREARPGWTRSPAPCPSAAS